MAGARARQDCRGDRRDGPCDDATARRPSADRSVRTDQSPNREQTESIAITADDRFRYLEQIMRGPLRTIIQNDRMRGKYLKLTFVFDNSLDEKIIFTNLMTLFRISKRT